MSNLTWRLLITSSFTCIFYKAEAFVEWVMSEQFLIYEWNKFAFHIMQSSNGQIPQYRYTVWKYNVTLKRAQWEPVVFCLIKSSSSINFGHSLKRWDSVAKQNVCAKTIWIHKFISGKYHTNTLFFRSFLAFASTTGTKYKCVRSLIWLCK